MSRLPLTEPHSALQPASPAPVRETIRLATLGLVGWLVVLGLALRSWHYLRGPSIWQDEAALVLNVLGKSFAELLGPLFFSEAAPPLFLWAEKLVHLSLGDGMYALRLLPWLASCLAMVLMVPLARRVVSPRAVPWALLLFAVSDRLLWHACEAKQYAVDVLVATLLLVLYHGLERWSLQRRLALFAALAPLTIWLSYPACFLYGGLLVAWLPSVWKEAHARVWIAYGLVVAAVFGAFGLLLAGPVRAQRNHEIVDCWQELGKFPDWQRPASVPWWIVQSTLEMVDYCCRPVGHALVPLVALGCYCLWRRGRGQSLTGLVVPVALALLASLLLAYPYGGVRVLAYAAPAVILLVAEGAAFALAWLETRHRAATLLLLMLLAAPAARSAWRAAFPWNRADSAGTAAYVLAQRQPDDLVTGNDWDYQYLFRHLDLRYFSPLIEGPGAPRGRTWTIITAGTADERKRVFGAFAAGNWRVLDHQEFVRTDVFLLEPAAELSTGGSRTAGSPASGRR